jgi:hypothetical protein
MVLTNSEYKRLLDCVNANQPGFDVNPSKRNRRQRRTTFSANPFTAAVLKLGNQCNRDLNRLSMDDLRSIESGLPKKGKLEASLRSKVSRQIVYFARPQFDPNHWPKAFRKREAQQR